MECQHFMKNWLSPKPILMLLILAPLFVQSITTISIPCPSTISGVPNISPRIDIGGYDSIPNPELESKRDIFIYWEAIKRNKTCGGGQFQYQAFYEVVTKGNKIKLVGSNSTYNNYALFVGLKTTVGYNFRVYSVNKYGQSEVYTKIYVPYGTEIRFLNPLTLKKSKTSDENGFNLTWKYSGDYNDQLNNYTLFWCENNNYYSYQAYQCYGDLNWIYLENSESHHYFTKPDQSKNYIFAISANGHSLFDIEKGIDQDVFMSGGMIWESCNSPSDMGTAYIQKIWISDIGVHSLGLRWKLDCIEDPEFITRYFIFYYPILFEERTEIIQKKMETKIIDKNQLVHQEIHTTYINNLKPNTSYVINIQAYSKQVRFVSVQTVGTTLIGSVYDA